MQELEIFRRAALDSCGYADRLKKKSGTSFIGIFCSYVPEEIITAAGAVPFRILTTANSCRNADSHIQSYACSLVRGGLDDALSGRLSFLDGAVFPHTCDSIQRLSDIWRLNAGFAFHFDIVLPVKFNTESARVYMKEVITRFRRELAEALNVEITEEALCSAIGVHNSIRDKLLALYDIRRDNPGFFNSSDLDAVMKASMFMKRDDCARALDLLVGAVLRSGKFSMSPGPRHGSAMPVRPGKRIMLSGGLCNHPDIYSMIEQAGASVVWDDLCSGSRYFTGNVPDDESPMDALTLRYAQRVVCPAKHSSVLGRAENLVRLAGESHADGLIFIFLKFCDPHAFDYPYLKETLELAGVPSMLLEIGKNFQAGEGERTRIETFVSTLK